MSQGEDRYLVLCVDRDDDLGTKTGVSTPVVGREKVLAAATKLALADPEEADANAIFFALKKFDELRRSGRDCEVAVVCGRSDSGFEADVRVGSQVQAVVKESNVQGIVLVSDGAEDEVVLPILQSIRPVVSVQRVVVKHSQTVEETYMVLGRYLRMLVFDPRYSKWTLGVPGLILLLAGILVVSHRTFEAELATLLIIGAAFFVRGFNVDRTVAGLLRRGPSGYIRLFSMLSSVLVIAVGLFGGYGYMASQQPIVLGRVFSDPSLLLTYGASLAGYFISGSLALVWAGMAIYAVGALLSHLARDSPRWRRDGLALLLLALLYLPVFTFSQVLIGGTPGESFLLISYVLIGMAAIFALSVTIYPKVRGAPAEA